MTRKLIMLIGWIMYQLERCKRSYVTNMKDASFKGSGKIGHNVELAYPSNITIGENSYINGGSIYASENAKITIGKNCLISYDVHLRTDTHAYSEKKTLINKQGSIEKDIIIEDDCWIGFGAQIMGGITVGRGAVIGAGAVLTKDAAPYGVYVGVPARQVKERT
ncbi:acyltransferase [Neobacillus niacini]|uniref:acyltransferase n=1 Tax=Neobacillus niacini TaxID=86668 RepID=UPI003002461E